MKPGMMVDALDVAVLSISELDRVESTTASLPRRDPSRASASILRMM